jgi:hypothetical protein
MFSIGDLNKVINRTSVRAAARVVQLAGQIL